MTPDAAMEALRAAADPGRAADLAAHHGVARPYLGAPGPVIDGLVADWRAALTLADRLALAGALWQTGVHEAMLAAAKLLTQARIRPDDGGAWALIADWAEGFEGAAVADAASIAGQKRLVADPARLDQVARWTQHPNPWTRRAVLTMTLPWAKMNHPKPADLAVRERVLGWAAGYLDDADRIVRKAVAAWLRSLARHDAARAGAFPDGHRAALGERMAAAAPTGPRAG
ncbi:MAG: DNA alkylation repair protein [Gemmobacter sp.]